jgi:hypothetical protein
VKSRQLEGMIGYGKMGDCMMNAPNPAVPVPPKMIKSLRAGFDAIANHVAVIIIPILLDLLLWLGPHVQIKQLLLNLIETLTNSSAWNSSQTEALLGENLELMQQTASRLNLISSLRAYPIGVPSLMAGKLPIEIPGGAPILWDVPNFWLIIAVVLILFLAGLGIGSLYFSIVAQAAVAGEVQWRKAIRDWPRAMLQVLSLTLALIIVFLVISIPTSCILSVIAWGGITLGQLAIFIFLGAIIWLGFPLIFTPHGIFADQNNVLVALRKSIRITRMTLPATSLFFLAILVISQGLDILWRVPAENSWFMLVGVAGHAFVTTGLLAASFVYYRDADRWVQSILAKMVKRPVNINPPV